MIANLLSIAARIVTRARRAGLGVLIGVAVLPSVGTAQGIPEQRRDDFMPGQEERLAQLFDDLGPGASVRVTTTSLLLEDARVGALSAGKVTLAREDLSLAVDLRDIRSVAVRDNHWLQGMLWGGISSAVLGSVVGAMVGSWGCTTPEGCRDRETSEAVRWGVIGGAVGGFGGFLIGRHSVYWRPVFP